MVQCDGSWDKHGSRLQCELWEGMMDVVVGKYLLDCLLKIIISRLVDLKVKNHIVSIVNA